jgi:hypothetical protein
MIALGLIRSGGSLNVCPPKSFSVSLDTRKDLVAYVSLSSYAIVKQHVACATDHLQTAFPSLTKAR